MAEFRALVIYGDGMQAIYCDEKNITRNRRGEKVIPILVAPSDELREKYGLTEEDLPIRTEEGKYAIWIEYPISEIDWLNKSPKGAVLYIWCAFDCSKTKIMDKMEGLLESEKMRDRNEIFLMGKNATLQSQLEDVTSNVVNMLKKMKEMEDALLEREEATGEEAG